MTGPEHHLWSRLRRRQLGGHRFRRQHAMGPYIVDFICLEKSLVVEVDGSQHLDSVADRQHDRWLQAQGFNVVRCWNNDVLDRTEQVLAMILGALA